MSESRPLIFRNSTFARLWIGQALAQTCTRMYQIAVTWWLVTTFSDQAGKISGAFMLVSAIPALAFVKKIGHVVDTTPGRKILIRSDLAMCGLASVISALVFTSSLQAPEIFLTGFLLAVLQAFYDPTLGKVAPSLVKPEDVEKAVGWMASTQSLANFSGALMGAVLIAKLGLGGVALLAAGGYIFSAACNWGLPLQKPSTAEDPAEMASTFSVLRELPFIRHILIGFGLVNFFLTPTLVILPLYVAQVLKGTASLLGFMDASIWAGLVVGSFAGGSVEFVKSKISAAIGCLTIMAASLVVAALFPSTAVYATCLFVIGAALGVNNVKFMAYFQETVADAVKGRFFAALQATIGFVTPVAFAIFGFISDFINPAKSSLVQGVGIAVLVFYFVRLKSAQHNTAQMPAANLVKAVSPSEGTQILPEVSP